MILVIQPGKIGDLVCTTPLLRTLEQHFRSPVDVMAGDFAPDLLVGNNSVRKIYPRTVDPKTLALENYTHALVLMPSYELWRKMKTAGIKNIWGTVHKYQAKKDKLWSFWFLTKRFPFDYSASAEEHYFKFVKSLGIHNLIRKREMHFRDSDVQKAREFLQENNLASEKIVGLAITAGKDFKQWGAENYCRLIDELTSHNYMVVGAGASADRDELENLKSKLKNPLKFFNIAGKFSLSEFAALCGKFLCFIGSDTAPLYIADALGVPVIDLMGPCFSVGQHPQGEQAIIVGECLSPAHPKARMMYGPSELSNEFQRCMAEISFEEVWEAFEKLAKKPGW